MCFLFCKTLYRWTFKRRHTSSQTLNVYEWLIPAVKYPDMSPIYDQMSHQPGPQKIQADTNSRDLNDNEKLLGASFTTFRGLNLLLLNLKWNNTKVDFTSNTMSREWSLLQSLSTKNQNSQKIKLQKKTGKFSTKNSPCILHSGFWVLHPMCGVYLLNFLFLCLPIRLRKCLAWDPEERNKFGIF